MDFHREDYYMAQIACEVRRMFMKNPNATNLRDFLLKFTSSREVKMTPEERTARSKMFWGAITGQEIS